VGVRVGHVVDLDMTSDGERNPVADVLIQLSIVMTGQISRSTVKIVERTSTKPVRILIAMERCGTRSFGIIFPNIVQLARDGQKKTVVMAAGTK